MESKEYFEKYIGVEVERIHYNVDDRGEFESITFCFKGGVSLHFEPGNGLNPFIKLTEATWSMVKAEEKVENQV